MMDIRLYISIELMGREGLCEKERKGRGELSKGKIHQVIMEIAWIWMSTSLDFKYSDGIAIFYVVVVVVAVASAGTLICE